MTRGVMPDMTRYVACNVTPDLTRVVTLGVSTCLELRGASLICKMNS